MVCLYLSHRHLHWSRLGSAVLLLLLPPPSANGRMYVRSLWDDSNSNKFDKYQFMTEIIFKKNNMKISNMAVAWQVFKN